MFPACSYKECLYGFDLKQLQASPHRPSRGSFKCVDWSTGKVRWATEEVGHAAPLIADDKLLLLTDTGELILARADPTAYHELARTQLFADEICWTPPMLWQGRLFVRSPSPAVCIDVGQPGGSNLRHRSPPPCREGWSVEASWLLSREREYPERCADLGRDGIVVRRLPARARDRGHCGDVDSRRRPSDCPLQPIFLAFAFLLGLLGPNLFSAIADRCLFTWPVPLYVAFHAAVSAYALAQLAASPGRARWLARCVAILFLLVVYLYYEACKTVGMYIFWSFLVGFPAALPFTYLAVQPRQSRWAAAFWTLLAFAVFFWSCQAMFLWKTSQAD